MTFGIEVEFKSSTSLLESMDVPALFAYPSKMGLTVRDSFFSDRGIVHGDGESDFQEVSRELRGETRRPLMVVDAESVGSSRFGEEVLKRMRVRGADIWFMTHVEYVEDVFDAFNTVAEMVFAPLHNIHDRHELEDILSVSDSFVPSMFVNNGKALDIDGRYVDLTDAIDSISSAGCCRMCVVDTDSSVTPEEWETVSDEHPALIPFVRREEFEVDFGEFRNVIRPYGPL